MITIKSLKMKGSEKITAKGLINSNGDGIQTYPNVSVFMRVVHPIKRVFCQAGFRLSSNNCSLCHLLANHTFDACKLFSGYKMPRMVLRLFNDLNENGIFPTKCPVTQVKSWIF